MVAEWQTKLKSLQKQTQRSLTRLWLSLERDLEPAMLLQALDDEGPLLETAQRYVRAVVPQLEREIIVAAQTAEAWGRQAAQDFGRTVPRTEVVWHDELAKVPMEAISGLRNSLDTGALKTVHDMRRGLARGFNRVLGVATDFPMNAFRGSLQQGDGPWTRVSAFARNTCMACVLLDGTVYEDAGAFDDHAHGMCFLVPGLLTDRQKGIDWFLGLTPEEQREIMGAEYWQAWEDDYFGLLELIVYTAEGYAIVEKLWRLKGQDSRSQRRLD